MKIASTQRALATSGHQAFPHGVMLPTGDVMVVWRRSSAHAGGTESTIRLSTSPDNGVTWTPSRQPFMEPGMDLRDPALAVTSLGLVLSYFKYPSFSTITSWVRLSTDNGVTWGPERRVALSSGMALSSPVVESGGRLIQVCYDTNGSGFDSIRMAESVDAATWFNRRVLASGPLEGRDLNEPVLVEGSGGVLHIFHRWGMADSIGHMTSVDSGSTWSTPREALEGISGRPSTLRLASGRLVLVARRVGADKAALVTSSVDEGLTWETPRILEVPEDLMTYAALVEVTPGVVLCVFGSQASPSTSTLYTRYLLEKTGVTPRGELVT